MSLDRHRRKVERRRSFFDRETAEKAKFHDATPLGVQFGQFFQRIIQGQQVHASTLDHLTIQGDTIATVSFCSAASSGIVNEDLPHQPGADGQKVGSVLNLCFSLLFKAQVRFVHEGRALQGMIPALLPKIVMGDQTKLLVNERKNGM